MRGSGRQIYLMPFKVFHRRTRHFRNQIKLKTKRKYDHVESTKFSLLYVCALIHSHFRNWETETTSDPYTHTHHSFFYDTSKYGCEEFRDWRTVSVIENIWCVNLKLVHKSLSLTPLERMNTVERQINIFVVTKCRIYKILINKNIVGRTQSQRFTNIQDKIHSEYHFIE